MATHTTVNMPQAQASTNNHPCGDLCDGRRQEYLDIAVPLYRASIIGDLKTAKDIFHRHGRHLVQYSITEREETPLHVASAGHSTRFVRYLVNMMEADDLELQNSAGDTAFCIAVISGNVDIVKIMFSKNRELLNILGSANMTPLHLAALHGNHEVVTFLYSKSGLMSAQAWTDGSRTDLLLECVRAGIFDVALKILSSQVQLPQVEHLRDMLHVLAQKRLAFRENRPTLSELTSLEWIRWMSTMTPDGVFGGGFGGSVFSALSLVHLLMNPHTIFPCPG
ncbi:hypothetical protein L1987_84499 [Smallanthus sonchifolius]|uniref:Uncharacterized protein n=1 Tax=Smallanthus sonchifolius TaxID=185202 RepID=A0ACB8YET3_9ASTR|nr:hypothetical protein L1987_84499 [Smallanthus sonchifolius]